MHNHHDQNLNQMTSTQKRIILVGNPNVGKSVIFSNLTGKYATVSNYPGTTVELTTGLVDIDSMGKYLVIDTPGTNSLIPSSEDERVTKRVLLEKKPEAVIIVGDMKNLRRTLHFAYQLLALLELKTPIILTLNMEDEAKKQGIIVNKKNLEKKLGIPIVFTTATENIGMNELKQTIENSLKSKHLRQEFRISYSQPLEDALRSINENLESTKFQNKRGNSEMLLRGDEELLSLLSKVQLKTNKENIVNTRESIQNQFSNPLYLLMTQTLDKEISKILDECVTKERISRFLIAEKLDSLFLNPITGTPIFLFTLFLIFFLVGVIGAGEFVDFFESVIFGEFLNPFAIEFFTSFIPIPIIQSLFVGEYGIITFGLTYAIAIVFPIVTVFFIAFAILEDSGYLPRLAFLADRLFRKIGLNGKAVLPIVLGTGCDTMATITTRILENRKERLITTMILALGIPCSAQLAVIFGLLTFLSPMGMIIVFGVVLSQVLLVAYLMNKTLSGQRSDFIIELPPLRIPKLKNVLIKTWSRVEWFLKEALPLFIIGSLVMSLLNFFTLFEIVVYILVLVTMFIIWKLIFNYLKEKSYLTTKKYAFSLSTTTILLVFFLLVYLSNIPKSLGTNFASLIPYSDYIFTFRFLEVTIELLKPIVVVLLGLPPESSVMFILGFLRRDYGTAGFFDMANHGLINTNQIIIGLIVITLFVPCIANFFVIAKEFSMKTAILMLSFIIPFAILVGTVVHFFFQIGGIII